MHGLPSFPWVSGTATVSFPQAVSECILRSYKSHRNGAWLLWLNSPPAASTSLGLIGITEMSTRLAPHPRLQDKLTPIAQHPLCKTWWASTENKHSWLNCSRFRTRFRTFRKDARFFIQSPGMSKCFVVVVFFLNEDSLLIWCKCPSCKELLPESSGRRQISLDTSSMPRLGTQGPSISHPPIPSINLFSALDSALVGHRNLPTSTAYSWGAANKLYSMALAALRIGLLVMQTALQTFFIIEKQYAKILNRRHHVKHPRQTCHWHKSTSVVRVKELRD